jgi:hypothetical protein
MIRLAITVPAISPSGSTGVKEGYSVPVEDTDKRALATVGGKPAN